MKILCVEDSADGLLDLAVRAQRLGHQARYHCRVYDPVRAPVGRGLVERAATWQESARWADLIVVGGNGKWIVELDRLRAQGVPIVGGCASVAALELDRLAGMAMFKRAGIPVPPFRQCSALREAIEYVAKEDTGFAVKVCGDVSDKSTSVVAKTAPALIWRLKRWEKEGRRFPSGVIVQERVEGVEFAVGAWCGPDGFAEGGRKIGRKRPFSLATSEAPRASREPSCAWFGTLRWPRGCWRRSRIGASGRAMLAIST